MPRKAKIAAAGLAVMLMLTSWVAALDAAPVYDEPIAPAAIGTIDDEVVLLLSDGRIRVEDPFHAAGQQPATWTSPEGGWTYVATGDFNGDGSSEIIAIGGSKAKIYDPFTFGGPPVQFELNISPHQFTHALAADINNNGRDELILQRTDSGDISARVLIYQGNPTGTQWTLIQNWPYGVPWIDIIAGNFVGDGRMELAMSREHPGHATHLITVINPLTGQQMASSEPGKEFIRLAAGDLDGNGYDEIIAVRDVHSLQGSNVVIYRVKAAGQPLEVVSTSSHTPPFLWVAAGDVNANGRDEIALLRSHAEAPSSLFVRDLAGNSLFSIFIGTGWTDLQTADINGNGRDEVLVLKGNEVRAYSVSTGTMIWSKTGAYRGAFAVGNVDGSGISRGPTLHVAPTSLSFEMDYDGALPAAQRVDVTNTTSHDVINWSVSVNPPVGWLSISPAIGSTPGSFMVSITGANVSPGDHATTIVVHGGAGVSDSPQNIPVSLRVRAPAMKISPTTMNVSARPGDLIAPRTIQVTQEGGGSGIHWVATILSSDQWESLAALGDKVEEISVTSAGLEALINGELVIIESIDWLSISPIEGTTPGNVQVSFDPAGLEMGAYRATVVILAGPNVIHRAGLCDVTLALLEPVSYLPLMVR